VFHFADPPKGRVSVPVNNYDIYSRLKGHLIQILGLLLLAIAAAKVLKVELGEWWPF
jgi:hypothetical protein